MGSIRDGYIAADRARRREQQEAFDREQRRREFWKTMDAVFVPKFVRRLKRWERNG